LTSTKLRKNFDSNTLGKDIASAWKGKYKSHNYEFFKCEKCNYGFATSSTKTNTYQ
jgi:hypothetical protein